MLSTEAKQQRARTILDELAWIARAIRNLGGVAAARGTARRAASHFAMREGFAQTVPRFDEEGCENGGSRDRTPINNSIVEDSDLSTRVDVVCGIVLDVDVTVDRLRVRSLCRERITR